MKYAILCSVNKTFLRKLPAVHRVVWRSAHPLYNELLLLTVKLQDTCGNDACLELKQLPGESTSILCYSTMGRRCLNFQLFRKGWQLCHNADGQLVGRFPSSADGLIDETDFRAYRAASRRTPAPVPLLPWRVL